MKVLVYVCTILLWYYWKRQMVHVCTLFTMILLKRQLIHVCTSFNMTLWKRQLVHFRTLFNMILLNRQMEHVCTLFTIILLKAIWYMSPSSSLWFLQIAAAVNNSHCICANMYVLKSMQLQSIFCWDLNRRGQKVASDEDELITKLFNLTFVI